MGKSEKMQFDDLFKYTGGFGYFQILQFVILGEFLSYNFFFSIKVQTRQRAQGHRTYEVGSAKHEVRFVLNL